MRSPSEPAPSRAYSPPLNRSATASVSPSPGPFFFSAVHAGYGEAFECSLVELVALLGVMVAVSRLLPSRRNVRLETLRPAMATKGKDQQ
jgi:hypothetical protein